MITAKKFVSVTLVAAFSITVFGCNEKTGDNGSGSFCWIDSNLFESIDSMKTADLKDDYAAAINYEWAASQEPDFSYIIGSAGDAQRTVDRNKRAMINDGSFSNKNIELIRTADGLFCDWEYRDLLGVEPLKKYLGYIDEIQSLDDVSSYMIDNDKNPFALSLVKLEYSNNESLDNYRALYFTKPDLTLGSSIEYLEVSSDAMLKKETVEKELKYLLGRCGYSDKEADAVIKGCFRFESEIAGLSDLLTMNVYIDLQSKEDVLEEAGNYPFKAMLEHYGIIDCEHYMGDFAYLDNLEKIYTQKNVEDMKAYFKAHLALESIYYLDSAAYDFASDAEINRLDPFAERIDRDPDNVFFEFIQKTPLTAAMDQAYLDYYFDETAYNEVCGFVHEIKAKYIILIDENENLSDKSKSAIKEKLDLMGENIIRPSNTADFTGVELKSGEEGGSYLDAMCVLSRINYEHIGDMVCSEKDRSFWDIYDTKLSTTKVAANYNILQNTFYIQLGMLVEPMYTPDAPIEQKLASFVTILGHEISHAFDSTGVKRDAYGRSNPLVSNEEMVFWNEAVAKMSSQFAGYQPFEGSAQYTSANYISGEVIADAEGVKVSLMIAKDYEDFDYDLYFRSFAVIWRKLNTKAEENERILTNPHPLHYLRINYTLRQFDEFIETYDIKPGDGMYLEPGQRILIW